MARATLRQDLWDDDVTESLVASQTEHDLRLDLVAAIESLPEPYRDVVVLRDFENLTIGEIGRELKLSPTAVKGRLQRARELTREYLLAR